MASIVILGSYIAGDSLAHRIDARIKLLLLTCFLTSVFLIKSCLGLGLLAVLLMSVYISGRIPVRMVLKALFPLVAILVLTVVSNGFGFSAAAVRAPAITPWLEIPAEVQTGTFVPLIGGFGFRLYGFLRGLFLGVRIVLLVCATSLLTFTSRTIDLSDALVVMLRPLAVFKVPTDDFAMVISITLHNISLIADETEQLMVAQQARGAVFDKGGPIQRGRAWLPVLVPLFIKLFSHAKNLTDAMGSRCYRGQGRTHLRSSRLKLQTLIAGLVAASLLVVFGVMF